MHPESPAARRGTILLNVQAAAQSLGRHRHRTGLTMLGVAIGVASAIILAAFGKGAERDITGQIATLGTNVAVVAPGKMQSSFNFNPMATLGLSNLTPEDVERLKQVRGVAAVAPLTFISGGVFRGDRSPPLALPLATTPPFARIRRLRIASGSFLTPERMGQQVCVLGMKLKEELFGDDDPIGKRVGVNDRKYEVIGVVGERNLGSGLFGGEELDAILYLPLTAATGGFAAGQIHRILVEIDPQRDPEHVVEAIRRAMLRTHSGRDDFTILRSEELLRMFYKVFNMFAVLLLGITSVSLIAGGIGIMNVMLVAVTERTSEIGIRKTVGARQIDIFIQFLAEALLLSLLGGAAGILIGAAACAAGARFLPLTPVIELSTVALALAVCAGVGVLSGVIPAVAAARKQPIEAVRYE